MASDSIYTDRSYAEALKRIDACRKKGKQGVTLNLRKLGLITLPLEIIQLTSLTRLDLGDNELTTLPSQIGQLTTLMELDLGDNELTMLPSQIGQLTALTELRLNGNLLTMLPPHIGHLTALTELHLSRNQLTTLPSQMGRLTALTSLSLRSNHLTTLPPQIGQLVSLTSLSLRSNQLTSLPPQIGQLSALTDLDLSGNQLAMLPPQIGQLTALTRLDIDTNRLSSLPPELAHLAALARLHLDTNQFSALPSEVVQLKTLTRLSLSHNQLDKLPAQIGQLTALNMLDLSGNRLTALPSEITWLKALTELYLHDNPSLGLPAEVLGPTWKSVGRRGALPKPPHEILDWYFRNREAQEKRPILEAKVILVGWGTVGKTSLRRRLIDGSFSSQEDSTHKIEITPWPVRLEKDQVKLHVWDFGGQEIMHATHQFFLTKRSLYVLVLSGREKVQGAQDAEYWLRLIQSFGGDSPVLVVMNKQHICPFDLNRQSLIEKYPFIKGFIQTDCEPPMGLDELKQKILQEVNRLPELRTEFDAKWMSIKNQVTDLKAKGRKRMTVEDYRRLCREWKEPEEKWQKWLLGFLHDLGVVVCFHEDRRLANDGLLDPQWVVDGIYKILNEPTLHGCDGQVDSAQVRDLLPRADYTDDDVRMLLDLMEKFELCFWPASNRRTMVVPELMMEQEGDWKTTFPDLERCLRFELKYEFLPEGLMPRFIVATHDLSKAGERWRSGVILRKAGNAALVRGDAAGSPPRVRIAVNGPVSTRRDLLTVVRHEFAKINGSITGLAVTEMVPVPGLNVEPLKYHDLLAAEQAGRKGWPVVANGEFLEIPLANLLDGIEPKEKRRVRAKQISEISIQHLHGDFIQGDKPMTDDHSIHIGGDVISSQVGQTLTNCNNMVNQQPKGERRNLLEKLQQEVKKLIEHLPVDKQEEAPQVAENLEMLTKQATSEKPNRKWYSVSAEGLLEASKWTKDMAGNIGETIKTLGKSLWPDFLLPGSK